MFEDVEAARSEAVNMVPESVVVENNRPPLELPPSSASAVFVDFAPNVLLLFAFVDVSCATVLSACDNNFVELTSKDDATSLCSREPEDAVAPLVNDTAYTDEETSLFGCEPGTAVASLVNDTACTGDDVTCAETPAETPFDVSLRDCDVLASASATDACDDVACCCAEDGEATMVVAAFGV